MYQNLRKKTNREQGFTIIEVLIVLAIAGLIMLIVFLAVPALQRNSRNNARNSEAARISAAVTECLANRNGQQDSCNSVAELGLNIGTDFQQFTSIVFAGVGSEVEAAVRFTQRCLPDGSNIGGANPTARDFAVLYQREPALTRCIGSQ
ncbi:MAG TPA: type II secretion system protein [Candidatus Limnocylindria bacterium]|nr:type II secretion system protein [Candidatus Limnocylindria bacterium]